MPLTSGTRLGPYEIVSPLGSGGMGEVYRARDTRLDRTVALKVLPADLSHDPEWRARFEREARAIAAVTHPHICTLHDVGEQSGVSFLVMELLDGQTLAARLSKGPLPMADVVKYALQIADALEHAHQRGIVHRDLKPANVVITPGGAKLLDFGLARRGAEAAPVEGLTSTTPLTSQGQILGTLQYMAPEQLEGRQADARADIFAFGAILYEMTTGRRAFEGASQAAVIGSILHTDPPPLDDLPAVPPAFARLVRTCLAKAPDDRWSTIHDVRLQLKDLTDARGGPEPATEPGSRRRERIALAIATVATLAALALAAMLFGNRAPPETSAGRDVVAILPPDGVSLINGEAPQISPDGRVVAFVAHDRSARRIYLRERGAAEARALDGTDEASLLFWSPDSRSLGYFAQGQLKTVATAGGSPQTIAPATVPRGGSWSTDGFIVYLGQPASPPLRVPAAGGTAPTPLPTGPDHDVARWFPTMLPDARHYLFFQMPFRLKLGSIDSSEAIDLVESTGSGAYISAGYLLYRREAALVAHRFDLEKRQLVGTPETVADNLGYHAVNYQSLFSASAAGDIALRDGRPGSELVWVDRQGQRLKTGTPPLEANTLCLTFDGRHVVYEKADAVSGLDLWTVDVSGGAPTRLTFDPAVDFYPACSPTSNEVIFASLREGRPQLFRMSIDAPGSEVVAYRSALPKIPSDWSRHDARLVFSELNPTTSFDVKVLPLGGGEPVTFAATGADERSGKLSPDGLWMAYVSYVNGRFEVLVQAFPAPAGKWQVSNGGGTQPQWRADGRELYYLAPDRRLMAAAVTPASSTFTFTAAQPLMDTRISQWDPSSVGLRYAVTADGERFLLSTDNETIRPVTLVRNWMAARN